MAEHSNAKISLLCLDGGGVRGLSSLRILQRIMECIDPNDPPKPCDFFDMICGTSTGGLIAIMLGRLKPSVSDCILEYKKLSASALEEGVKDLLRRLKLPENELLKEASGNPRCKTFVCSMSQQTSDIVIFPSYYSRTWGMSMFHRVRIWEAERATSAATSFFDPLVIDEASSIYRPCDGWKLDDDLKCVVSIGTGIPSSKPFGPGIGGVAKALVAIATAAENTAEQFQRQHPSQGIGLEEANRLGDIEACTDRYCASASVMQSIESCVEKLSRRQCRLFSSFGLSVSN
ncbi:FabD/lysophospholipase-like protein [Hyaloscypha hepaticicola]|uniref:FabD/lysophospholipase-like protein n=1 Tax=Hyaloscypha hepaticicola TaxID=2082293 RepID=A0A2J6QKZ1_9HELO|nr:FabD/lysophospholipase-like protein [Hyaloscypha hepaticicola]